MTSMMAANGKARPINAAPATHQSVTAPVIVIEPPPHEVLRCCLTGRTVDERNDHARAKQLNEVGDCLEQREPEPDVQAHVVVQHERASGKGGHQEAKTHP